MRGCLHVASRFVAVLLAAAFVVSLPLSLVAFNIGRVAFSPERMTTLLVETIDETGGLRQMVIESLTAGEGTAEGGGLDLAGALEFLTPQERDYLGEQLTPPGWAKASWGRWWKASTIGSTTIAPARRSSSISPTSKWRCSAAAPPTWLRPSSTPGPRVRWGRSPR